MNLIKTTMEIDEDKLERVMKLGKFSTRKEAMDWALTEAERIATLNNIENNPWSPSVMEGMVDPDYDVMAVRQLEAPRASYREVLKNKPGKK
ncbi:MAG: hypothetical protein JWO94_2060 [Verrucomicrobiaceae bacterium]|nr:hypothetical protein [Verrucomicrobiaceae bacterium]